MTKDNSNAAMHIAIAGNIGSGKTTFLRTLTGLQKALNGKIIIGNTDIKNFRSHELARIIGFVSTFLPDNPEMTVEELVRIGRYPYTNFFGVLRKNDVEKIAESISVCGINHLKDKPTQTLSDGERQKAMLARAFAQDTDIILLDEPTSFLDIPNKFEIFHLLKDLAKEGKTIIFTTHDLNLATSYADKLWLIHEKIISEGAPEDMFLGPEIARLFASEKLRLDPETGDIGPGISPGASVILNYREEHKLAGIWTKKALLRKGIEVRPSGSSTEKTAIRITILKEKNKFVWNLQYENQNLFLVSIYQLIYHLEKITGHELN